MKKFIYVTQYDSVHENATSNILNVEGIRLIEPSDFISKDGTIVKELISNLASTHPCPSALKGNGTSIMYEMTPGNTVSLFVLENFQYFINELKV